MDLKNIIVRTDIDIAKDKIMAKHQNEFMKIIGFDDIYRIGWLDCIAGLIKIIKSEKINKNDLVGMLRYQLKSDDYDNGIKDYIKEILKDNGYEIKDSRIKHLTDCFNSGYYCPYCNKKVSEIKLKNYKHCFNCGKELDWNDIEEL